VCLSGFKVKLLFYFHRTDHKVKYLQHHKNSKDCDIFKFIFLDKIRKSYKIIPKKKKKTLRVQICTPQTASL